MGDPFLALVLGTAVLALAGILFWPDGGIVARWKRMERSSERVRIEDALKHLYDCEYKKITCTRRSIAGALGISDDESARLLSRLESLGLLTSDAGSEGVMVTNEGRSYALRIIRVHRLWERYLADETGVEEMRWHDEAERQEHRLSDAEANALARYMGNPPFDPHGDPIPTAAGDLPRAKGKAMTTLAPGETAEIIHVEDEPPIVYAQIVALGLSPGMQIRVHENNRQRVRFEVEGSEHVLAPIAARNVTVVPLVSTPESEIPAESLAMLEPGEQARIIGISRACRGMQRRRLMDLGMVPGTIVRAELRGAGGDPTAYRIRGALIALRNIQASLIRIERVKDGNV
jgi:DtxR family Mn-dependent transcriptional regulator